MILGSRLLKATSKPRCAYPSAGTFLEITASRSGLRIPTVVRIAVTSCPRSLPSHKATGLCMISSGVLSHVIGRRPGSLLRAVAMQGLLSASLVLELTALMPDPAVPRRASSMLQTLRSTALGSSARDNRTTLLPDLLKQARGVFLPAKGQSPEGGLVLAILTVLPLRHHLPELRVPRAPLAPQAPRAARLMSV